MLKNRDRNKTIVIAAALIVLAFVLRIVYKTLGVFPVFRDNIPLLIGVDKLLNLSRTFIYFGVFIAWSISVRRRVVRTQVKSLLTVVAFLIIGWFLLRSIKFLYSEDDTVIRYIWYCYYIPIIIIPTLAVFVSLSLGQSEWYMLFRQSFFLLIPTTALAFLVLTNDLHQWVFVFPSGSEFTEANYSYNFGYYIVAAWDVLCGAVALIVMFKKNRIPSVKKLMLVPLLPLMLLIVAAVLFVLKVPFFTDISWDSAAWMSLMYLVFFECCLQSGLIQINSAYEQTFKVLDIPAAIVDNDYEVKYQSMNKVAVEKDVLIRAADSEVMLPDGKRIHNMPIRGGHAIWVDDVSEITALRDRLSETQEELKERKDFLEYEYRQEEAHKIVEERNRLFDMLQAKTQRQLDEIDRLTKEYSLVSSEQKRRILAKIVFLGSYIKRRKDMILMNDQMNEVPDVKLGNAFGESMRMLKLLNVNGSFSVYTGAKKLPSECVPVAYDFFEDIAESVLDEAHYLNVRVAEVNGALRESITVDADLVVDDLMQKYPDMTYESDCEDSTFVLPLFNGGAL